jgi:hypothetical protein
VDIADPILGKSGCKGTAFFLYTQIILHFFAKKEGNFAFFCQNIWSIQKKAVILQAFFAE